MGQDYLVQRMYRIEVQGFRVEGLRRQGLGFLFLLRLRIPSHDFHFLYQSLKSPCNSMAHSL